MKKIIILTFISLCLVQINYAQSYNRGELKVTPNGHYLQYEDGTPFFWLGDTGWELFHRLTLEEINQYLDNRHKKGFNVIQAVLLAELDGLRVPNRYGDLPLINMDPATPNEKYFRLVDSVINLAADKNMILALLPSWGDKVTLNYGGRGPVIFTPQNAYQYGFYLGKRYKSFTNIVWILGGDRPPTHDCNDWKPIWAAMARGLDEGSGKHTLKTFHPGGSVWESAVLLHNENWMDFNMTQSGHAERDQPVWKNMIRDWHMQPAKPVIDGEPNYEDLAVNPWNWKTENGYFTDYDVRKQLYRSVFAGGFGATYGQSSIWRMHNAGLFNENYTLENWDKMLDRPGAYQTGYLRMLIESRPYVNRIPDPTIIVEGQGVKNDYITSFKDSEGRYLMAYLPIGKTIKINTSSIPSKQVKAWWFNPKTAQSVFIGTKKNTQIMEFTAPTTGVGNDWVLVIDNNDLKYTAPVAKLLK